MKRAVRARWPGVIEAEDIRHVTRQKLELVTRQAVTNGCNVCFFREGFSYQDVSLLNAGRDAIEGNRSSLFRELCRLAADVQSLCRMAGLDFCGFAECVLMSAADEAAVTRELCWPLVLLAPRERLSIVDLDPFCCHARPRAVPASTSRPSLAITG